jgi:hypothetical protein
MANVLPIFICECCTVRQVLGRELSRNPYDIGLLALERMRLIDMVHHWAPGTVANYQGRLRKIQQFGQTYKCPVLPTPQLASPPISDAIPLMWAQQHYSLQKRQRERFEQPAADDNGRVGYGSIRHFRSAAALHHAWITMVNHPGRVVLDGNDKPIAVTACRVTDDMSYKLMSAGMSKRLGEKPVQSAALLDRHVRWIDRHLEKMYHKAVLHDNEAAREVASAAVCNLQSWLGWLRGGETFGINWCDIDIVMPQNSQERDLPAGVGAILQRLLEQTKTSQTSAADMVLAFTTRSGYELGKWLFRLRKHTDADSMDPKEWTGDTRPLFCTATGDRWTSKYFREKFLIPFLEQQRLEGDKYLLHFANLRDAFWSMHSYRIGARSHVSIKREFCHRKATDDEVNEHGRWRKKKESEAMKERYRQWTIRDRLMITFLCM